MTNLHEIYEAFLGTISDYRILALAKKDKETGKNVLDDVLFSYFKSARAKFFRCKNSLEVNTERTLILTELTDYEIEIIVNLMLVSHITPQLYSSENMKQSLSDKDFKIYSQANQLREIRLLLQNLKSSTSKMITQYTFMSLGGVIK